MKLRSKMWDHFTPDKVDDVTKNLWEHCNEGCSGQESADAGTSEQPPQPLPSLAQDDEAMQQLPPLPPVPLPPSTHRGSVNKDGGAVRQLGGAETSRRGRSTAPRRPRQPPHGVGRQHASLTPRRGRQSPSAIALFLLSNKGKHVRREAAGIPCARRVSDARNRLGSVVLTLDELKQITNNFSHDQLLGEGAFGKVYKGVLRNGHMIAVKRFASTITGLQDGQYENEAQHLMRLKHPNIVQLLGYCFETEIKLVWHNGTFVRAENPERLLCLEHMPKGSLRGHLSDETCGLEWNTRYKIIEGICYGLHYLHEEWQATPIIHMDLKPANILLDDNMVPKIADFGLSRLFGEEQTRTCTISCKGTPGYMAPEYIEKGVITKKFDIFSLGVIIIEIITGLKDYPTDETETASQQYIDLVLNKWKHRLRKAQRYTSQDIDYQQIKKCIQIGLLCVKFDRVKRPTINQIIKMLEGSDDAYQNERESALKGARDSSNIIAKKTNTDPTRNSFVPGLTVRKEKPGDKITALQLVFPFGKHAMVAAANAANRAGDAKSSGASNAMPPSASAHTSAANSGATAMNLSFANLQADTQFLAIRQNGYPFQVAAHPGYPFECKTCSRRFPSFQALGEHRASHKRPRAAEAAPASKPRAHECAVCGLEFPSFQLLGGHMRRHREERHAAASAHGPALDLLGLLGRGEGLLDLDLNIAPSDPRAVARLP